MNKENKLILKAQEIIDETKQPSWDKKSFLTKFYPNFVKLPLKKENVVRGFRMVYRKLPEQTAEEIVNLVKEEDVGIKKPKFGRELKDVTPKQSETEGKNEQKRIF